MKRLNVVYCFFIFMFCVAFSQAQKETYFKDAFLKKVVNAKNAKFKVVEIQETKNIKRRQVFNLNTNCLVKDEVYQDEKPVGVWSTYSFTDCSLLEKRDFSKLVYSKPVIDSISDPSKRMPNVSYETARLGNDSTGILKYVMNNTKYPSEAVDDNIKGMVIIQFKVTAGGKVQPITILRSGGAFLDYATWDLIESMPNFKPFKRNGIAMDSYFTLPVRYELD